jgi:hypothetical protein
MKQVEELAIQTYNDHAEKFGNFKQKCVELVKRYENQLREGSITAETQTKTKLGQAFALVENFVSRVIANNPQFNYLARERKDTNFVEQYKEFNEYQNQEADSLTKFELVAKWGAICGLAGFKMGWRREEILHKKKGKEVMGKVITNPLLVETMDKMKIGKSIKVDDNETISNWTIDSIAPWDLVWSIDAEDPEDADIKGHLVHDKTYKQLKQEGYDMRKLSYRIRNEQDYWKEQTEKYKGISTNKILEETKVEIAELYVRYLNNGIYEYWVVTLADISDNKYGGKPVAVRVEKNPFDKQFCPVGFFRPIKRPGKMYGFGIIEPVADVLDNEEDTLNMVSEAFWTDVARPMEYNPNNIIDEDALEYKPRTLVPVRRLGESVAVMPTPTPNMGNASFMLGYLEKSKQNITAITDYQTGANQLSKSQTATEVRTKTFLSEQRTNKILQRFESDVLQKAGKMALWLNKQYLSNDKKVIYRVLGRKGEVLEKDIKLKDIEAIKDVVIVSGTSAYIDANEEMQKWSSLLNLSYQEAQMGPMGLPLDREYIWKKLLENGYRIKDPDNIIPSLKEREEADVKDKQAQLKDAKSENLDPATARVLPSDNTEVHLRIHQAAARNNGMTDDNGQFIQYTPEQQQMLAEHINRHTEMAGGQNPNFANAMEQLTTNQITNATSDTRPPQQPQQRN